MYSARQLSREIVELNGNAYLELKIFVFFFSPIQRTKRIAGKSPIEVMRIHSFQMSAIMRRFVAIHEPVS